MDFSPHTKRPEISDSYENAPKSELRQPVSREAPGKDQANGQS
jgi:hypothetical protein